MDPFVYRDGDDVPPDVTRVVVHRSVRFLPPQVFRGCKKLEEVRLNRGLKEIGDKAFQSCVSLRRLTGPFTVVRIGASAFMGCKRLEEIQLNEGLEEIGDGAFYGCVSLGRLDCPSTVVRIRAGAFGACRDLSAVELAGILSVERGAFSRSIMSFSTLETRVQIPRAIVVQQGNYHLVTDGRMTIARTSAEFVLVAPGCLTALPESSLPRLGNSIGAIVNSGEGAAEERLCRVRQVVRQEVRGEVSAILGLAFWKAKIEEAKRAYMGAANDDRQNMGGWRKRAEVDVLLTREARDGCRGEGKGKVIAQNVLPFLDALLGNGSQGGP